MEQPCEGRGLLHFPSYRRRFLDNTRDFEYSPVRHPFRGVCHFGRTRPAPDPVSYTHLDVYKRQALNALILETIRTTASYAIQNKEEFIQKVRSISQVRQQEAAKELKRKVAKERKRSAELDAVSYTHLTWTGRPIRKSAASTDVPTLPCATSNPKSWRCATGRGFTKSTS